MRGEDRDSGALFSYVSCEARVLSDHRLRAIRAIVEEALEVLSSSVKISDRVVLSGFFD